MAECRSCGADIIWAITDKGKKMPLDAEPVTVDEKTTLAWRLGAEVDGLPTISRQYPGHLGYTSHFATCPDANRHRRSR